MILFSNFQVYGLSYNLKTYVLLYKKTELKKTLNVESKIIFYVHYPLKMRISFLNDARDK